MSVKYKLTGENVAAAWGANPVPVIATEAGDPGEFVATVIVADSDPTIVDANVTYTVQESPGKTRLGVPQLSVSVKSAWFVPDTAMLEMVRSPGPVLDRVNVWRLEVLVCWLGKESEDALTESCGVPVRYPHHSASWLASTEPRPVVSS